MIMKMILDFFLTYSQIYEILQVLAEIQDSQLNIKSESAREILADKLNNELQAHVSQIIESCVVGHK